MNFPTPYIITLILVMSLSSPQMYLKDENLKSRGHRKKPNVITKTFKF